MALSGMSSRERNIVIVLAVVIIIALVGIGVLAATLLTADDDGDAAAAATTLAVGSAEAGATTPGAQPGDAGTAITPVPPPEPEAPADEAPAAGANQPIQVARAEGVGPGSPVIIAAQPLHPGRRYRIEITAADGSAARIRGSWSQAATSSGAPAAPEINFFDGTTPHTLNVVAPVSNPDLWSCSVSATAADILGQPPTLIITIWDVTEAE